MKKFSYGNVVIRFKHWRGVTACQISHAGQPVSSGAACWNQNDEYDPVVGEKLALKRALAPGRFGKMARAGVWTAYFAASDDEASEPEPQYRLLNVGEAIRADDEYIRISTYEWTRVGHDTINDALPWIYRRKLDASEVAAIHAEGGDVYRLLGRDECLKAGDNILVNREWESGLCQGQHVGNCIARRKIEPPKPQYRRLEVGETIQDGDEFRLGTDWFLACGSVMHRVGPMETYRRKL